MGECSIPFRGYSREYGDNWAAAFRGNGRLPVTVDTRIELVRLSETRAQVAELREEFRKLVATMPETDRMRAWREFNAAVPLPLAGTL